MNSVVYNEDCMEGMKRYPDKHFDLAIVDPPYGSDNIKGGYTSSRGGGNARQNKYNNALWDQARPPAEYFTELMRVSKNQIIWGANHFISLIPIASSCWIVWDKQNEKTHFADCELAWTSFPTAVRKFAFRWSGYLQGDMKNKEVRIHPTQKPVQLYKWLLTNYGQAGDKILDTHLGGGSSRIAAHKLGFDFTGFEINEGYYNDGEKRFKQITAQTVLL